MLVKWCGVEVLGIPLKLSFREGFRERDIIATSKGKESNIQISETSITNQWG